jgi:hypothetical protein
VSGNFQVINCVEVLRKLNWINGGEDFTSPGAVFRLVLPLTDSSVQKPSTVE